MYNARCKKRKNIKRRLISKKGIILNVLEAWQGSTLARVVDWKDSLMKMMKLMKLMKLMKTVMDYNRCEVRPQHRIDKR